MQPFKKIILIFSFIFLITANVSFAGFTVSKEQTSSGEIICLSNQAGSECNLWNDLYPFVFSTVTGNGIVHFGINDINHQCIAGCSGTPWNYFNTTTWQADATPPTPESFGMTFINTEVLTGDNSIPNVLGASVGTTTTGLLPLIAIVGGVILAFIGIRFIVSLFNETKQNKTK